MRTTMLILVVGFLVAGHQNLRISQMHLPQLICYNDSLIQTHSEFYQRTEISAKRFFDIIVGH